MVPDCKSDGAALCPCVGAGANGASVDVEELVVGGPGVGVEVGEVGATLGEEMLATVGAELGAGGDGVDAGAETGEVVEAAAGGGAGGELVEASTGEEVETGADRGGAIGVGGGAAGTVAVNGAGLALETGPDKAGDGTVAVNGAGLALEAGPDKAGDGDSGMGDAWDAMVLGDGADGRAGAIPPGEPVAAEQLLAGGAVTLQREGSSSARVWLSPGRMEEPPEMTVQRQETAGDERMVFKPEQQEVVGEVELFWTKGRQGRRAMREEQSGVGEGAEEEPWARLREGVERSSKGSKSQAAMDSSSSLLQSLREGERR